MLSMRILLSALLVFSLLGTTTYAQDAASEQDSGADFNINFDSDEFENFGEPEFEVEDPEAVSEEANSVLIVAAVSAALVLAVAAVIILKRRASGKSASS